VGKYTLERKTITRISVIKTSIIIVHKVVLENDLSKGGEE